MATLARGVDRGGAVIRGGLHLLRTSCVIAGSLGAGVACLLLSLFRRGSSATAWASVGAIALGAAVAVCVFEVWPRCPDCGRPYWRARWCATEDCGRWLGPVPQRWE